MNYKAQLTFFFTFSVLVGLISNSVGSNGISWLAKPIDTISDPNDAVSILGEPEIREVDLNMARSLHQSGILFVDARAEEYLTEGIIPGAIGNDDVGLLAEQIDYLIGTEKGFVIYCSDDDCGSSEELAYELQDLGFNNILVFKGCRKSWIDAGLATERNE